VACGQVWSTEADDGEVGPWRSGSRDVKTTLAKDVGDCTWLGWLETEANPMNKSRGGSGRCRGSGGLRRRPGRWPWPTTAPRWCYLSGVRCRAGRGKVDRKRSPRGVLSRLKTATCGNLNETCTRTPGVMRLPFGREQWCTFLGSKQGPRSRALGDQTSDDKGLIWWSPDDPVRT